MDVHQSDIRKMILFSTSNFYVSLCSSNLATSRGLITFSSIKQVTPLSSFSSSGFCVPVAERAHHLFLRGKIVRGIATTEMMYADAAWESGQFGDSYRWCELLSPVITESNLRPRSWSAKWGLEDNIAWYGQEKKLCVNTAVSLRSPSISVYLTPQKFWLQEEE